MSERPNLPTLIMPEGWEWVPVFSITYILSHKEAGRIDTPCVIEGNLDTEKWTVRTSTLPNDRIRVKDSHEARLLAETLYLTGALA